MKCYKVILYRSVLTNGHCVCDQKYGPCLLPQNGKEPNQITKNNKLSIVSGDNRKRKYINLGFYKIPIKVGIANEIIDARIKYLENYEKSKHGIYEYDIAVLKSSKAIYKDGDTTRAPICLGALSANYYTQNHDDVKIKTVGWGKLYYEYPARDPFFYKKYGREQIRDPVATACSTNEYGPTRSRFRSCDIDFLKKNKWSCKKIKNIKKRRPKVKELPNIDSKPSYKFDECEKYFSEAEGLLANELSESSIKWTEVLGNVKNLDVFQVIDSKNNGEEFQLLLNCYRKELFETHGWCKTMDAAREGRKTNHDDWGFCDRSCEEASVRIEYLLA